jgi:hypothetical protein
LAQTLDERNEFFAASFGRNSNQWPGMAAALPLLASRPKSQSRGRCSGGETDILSLSPPPFPREVFVIEGANANRMCAGRVFDTLTSWFLWLGKLHHVRLCVKHPPRLPPTPHCGSLQRTARLPECRIRDRNPHSGQLETPAVLRGSLISAAFARGIHLVKSGVVHVGPASAHAPHASWHTTGKSVASEEHSGVPWEPLS